MLAPTLVTAKAYLGDDSSWSDADVTATLAAETAAQARACRIPTYDAPDLVEALLRRVARNLAMRSLPLGYQESITEIGSSFNRIGRDAEIGRLEAPFRRLVIG